MNTLANRERSPTLAGNAAHIFDHFLSKFSTQPEINPITKTRGFTCIANFLPTLLTYPSNTKSKAHHLRLRVQQESTCK